MSANYKDFFDIDSGNKLSPEPTSKETEFFDIPSKETKIKPPSPPANEQLKNAPELFAREGIAQLYSLPSTTAEIYRHLAGKIQELGEKQAATEGRELTDEDRKFTDKMVNYLPDLIQDLGEKFPNLLPNYEQAKEKVGAKIEEKSGKNLPEEGRGGIERGAIGAGKAIPIAVFPGSAAVKGAAIGTSAALEGMDVSEKSKFIGNLSVPALVSVAESIINRRYTPAPGDAQQLYRRGRNLGMTDEQLAPILATEGQVGRHGALASGTARARDAFETTGQALGNAIENVQNRAGNTTPLATPVQNQLVTRLQAIEADLLGRTHTLSPREQTLLDFVTHTVQDIQANGSDPRRLIGTWRSVNQIGAGRTALSRLKEPIMEALEATNPQLAQDLNTTNRLYGRYLNNLREINPSQFNAFVDAGELQHLVGAVFSGDPNTLTQSLLRFVGLKALRNVSASILTNPTAQSLVRNFGRAVRDGRPASARAVANQLKEYVKKNLPEDYKEIDWDKLDIKD